MAARDESATRLQAVQRGRMGRSKASEASKASKVADRARVRVRLGARGYVYG